MLIGISGKLRTGKDLFYQNLGQYRHFHNKKFAAKLKEVLCVLTGCTMAQLEDQAFKDTYLPVEWNRWRVYQPFNGDTIPASKYFATQDEAEGAKMKLEHFDKYHIRYFIREDMITYRIMMQEVGTDLFRDKFHPLTWINASFVDYKEIPARGETWLGHAIGMDPLHSGEFPDWAFTDCRFPNEADAIKRRGGFVFRVNRPRELRGLENLTHPEIEHHESETALDNYTGFDAILNNDGTLEEFFQQVTDIVNKFNLKKQ